MSIQSSKVKSLFKHSSYSPVMTSCENSPVKSSPSFPDDLISTGDAMDHNDTLINQSTPSTSPLIKLPIKTELLDSHEISPPKNKQLDAHSSSNDHEQRSVLSTTTTLVDAHTPASYTASPIKNERLMDIQDNCLDDSVSGQQDSSDLENKLFRDDFDILQSPCTAADKKIHWTNKQVHLLLDMVEQRLTLFKSRGVHANVWTQIGAEISSQYPQITTKHCYNKWKNLRRDVRLSLVNPNKSLRNADVLKRMSSLVTEMYPGDLDGISQVASPNASLTPFKKISSSSPSPNVKKDRKTIRHPKLTSKHLARQFNKDAAESPLKNENLSDHQPLTQSEESTVNSNTSKFESLLSAAAQSLMQDLQNQQFRQNQSYPPDDTDSASCFQDQQRAQNMTNTLINNGLTSLLINPTLLINSQLLNGLINQSINQTQATDQRLNNNNNDLSNSDHPKANDQFRDSQSAHDLRVKSDLHFSPSFKTSAPPLSHENVPSMQNNSRWTQDQIYELIDLLKTFHTEETRHTTLVEQMVEMALNLKAAAYRRLSALDDLLTAFSNHQ